MTKWTDLVVSHIDMLESDRARIVLEVGGEVNRANWTSAMTEQGFTPNDRSLPKLNSERIWFDKTSPNFGEGN